MAVSSATPVISGDTKSPRRARIDQLGLAQQGRAKSSCSRRSQRGCACRRQRSVAPEGDAPAGLHRQHHVRPSTRIRPRQWLSLQPVGAAVDAVQPGAQRQEASPRGEPAPAAASSASCGAQAAPRPRAGGTAACSSSSRSASSSVSLSSSSAIEPMRNSTEAPMPIDEPLTLGEGPVASGGDPFALLGLEDPDLALHRGEPADARRADRPAPAPRRRPAATAQATAGPAASRTEQAECASMRDRPLLRRHPAWCRPPTPLNAPAARSRLTCRQAQSSASPGSRSGNSTLV